MSPTTTVRRVEPAQLDELAPLWLALHHHHQATTTSVPIVRGDGVGTAIMDEVDHQLAAIGIHNVEIDVMQGNDRAREFYERRGYVLGQVYLFKVGSCGGRP
jgi:GNAT superfamily N-acetyltransferase